MSWAFSTIGDVCVPTSQRNPASGSGDFRYIDIAGIDRDAKVIATANAIPCNEAPSRARKEVKAGDVLVSTVRPNLNAVAQVPPELDGEIASTGFTVLRAKRNVVDARYLFYRVQHREFVDSLVAHATGASYPAVSDAVVRRAALPLPPPAEQRRIVEILDQADALRKRAREADAKAARILPALFLKMFGDPATNPMGWPIRELGKLGHVVTGKTPPTKNDGMFDGDIPFATPSDLDDGLVTTARTVTQQGAAFSKTVRAGSALVGCIGNVGKMAKTPTRTAFNQQINAVEWYEDVNEDFGITALGFVIPMMQALATSTTLPILNKSAFSSIRIVVPPAVLQEKFAQAARGTTQMLRSVSAANHKLRSVFDVLLRSAFSGQLTTKWREAHMQELLVEMQEQARLLKLPAPN